MSVVTFDRRVERSTDTVAPGDHQQTPRLHGAVVDLGATAKAQKPKFEVPRELRHFYGPGSLLLVWTALSAIGVFGPRVFPAPWAVVAAGIDLTRSGVLQEHLWASLQRVFLGFAVGLVIGLTLAVIAGTMRRFEDTIDSSMQIMKAIPNFTLVPLLVIWMGINEAPKVTLIVLSVSVPVYINTYGAIRNVDSRLVESAVTLGLNRWQRVWHIILPGAVPGFLISLRFALTSAWLALVFAETINAQRGLGALMNDARSWWQLDVMVLVIAIYALLGLISYSFVRFLERRLLVWRRGYKGE
ncbi:ABC transporter permease [Marinivivus vitaminiproducens]|uniref:ABC transporter permease n=1 Tax=Marinivivus vitaminiproducens TaxID=3035935 RepID=UPI00279AD308|nr:ABC transporter permease [Geminicoccaceae bacterium SCSIO 64248]